MNRVKGEHVEESGINQGHPCFVNRFVIRVSGIEVKRGIYLGFHPHQSGIVLNLRKGTFHHRGQGIGCIGIQDSSRKLDHKLEKPAPMLVEAVHRILCPDPAEYHHKRGQSQHQSKEIDQGRSPVLTHDPQDHFNM